MMAAMVYVRTDLRLGQTSMRTCTELVGATNNNKLAQTLPENCLTNTRDHSQAALRHSTIFTLRQTGGKNDISQPLNATLGRF